MRIRSSDILRCQSFVRQQNTIAIERKFVITYDFSFRAGQPKHCDWDAVTEFYIDCPVRQFLNTVHPVLPKDCRANAAAIRAVAFGIEETDVLERHGSISFIHDVGSNVFVRWWDRDLRLID